MASLGERCEEGRGAECAVHQTGRSSLSADGDVTGARRAKRTHPRRLASGFLSPGLHR